MHYLVWGGNMKHGLVLGIVISLVVILTGIRVGIDMYEGKNAPVQDSSKQYIYTNPDECKAGT